MNLSEFRLMENTVKKLIVCVVALLSFSALLFAQQAPAPEKKAEVKASAKFEQPPVLTAEEKLEIRNAQIDAMQAWDAVQKTQEYGVLTGAQNKQRTLWSTIYAKYKIDPAKFTLCDGPGPVPCDTVTKGQLEFRPVPVKEAKK